MVQIDDMSLLASLLIYTFYIGEINIFGKPGIYKWVGGLLHFSWRTPISWPCNFVSTYACAFRQRSNSNSSPIKTETNTILDVYHNGGGVVILL